MDHLICFARPLQAEQAAGEARRRWGGLGLDWRRRRAWLGLQIGGRGGLAGWEAFLGHGCDAVRHAVRAVLVPDPGLSTNPSNFSALRLREPGFVAKPDQFLAVHMNLHGPRNSPEPAGSASPARAGFRLPCPSLFFRLVGWWGLLAWGIIGSLAFGGGCCDVLCLICLNRSGFGLFCALGWGVDSGQTQYAFFVA